MSTPTEEIRCVDRRRVVTPEYRSWQMMKNRCNNPNARDYKYYGAKGIRVYESWNASFLSFLADMGRRPSLTHTLERRDTALHYTPENCCWATRQEQARNRPYAKTKSWLLAKLLNVKPTTAAHMIYQVRAKDRGDTAWFELSKEREALVRNFLENTHETSV